jgi:3-deoxy-D-manno-octulosonate 8-phosphate phosphatase (KDO 8-P phosphatase)
VLDQELARRVKIVGLDVDGVLTDGSVFLGLVANHPLEFKRFFIPDGLGVKLLQSAGLPVVLVSGRASEATEARAQELEVDELLEVAPDQKLVALENALERRGLSLQDCAYAGDDLADLPVLRAVGFPIAVANAVPELKAAARFVTTLPGGEGAVRQIAELILKARGDWTRLLAKHFEAHDGARPPQRSH